MKEKSPGVRSIDHAQRICRNRGFSLVEVMMSVVLLAIGTVLAIPSFQDQVEKRQITNGAEQLASFVSSAQGAAMKTNRTVTVTYSFTDSNDWCIGAVDSTDGCDCAVTNEESEEFCSIGSQGFRLDDSIASDRGLVHAVDGDGAYALDPARGLLSDVNDALTMELRSMTGAFRLNLVVNNVGRVTICSDDEEHAVPGYDVCPPDRSIGFVGVEI